MTEIKKTATVKPVEKEAIKTAVAAQPTAVAVSEKAAEVKAEVKEPAAKAKTAKAAGRKPAAKKTAAKASTARAATAKAAKAATKVEAKKPTAKKTAVKQEINLQFSGKSYSMEDLVKIASDVWKYDLHKSEEAYQSLELYVKPEESVAYYVFNGEITGSFFI